MVRFLARLLGIAIGASIVAGIAELHRRAQAQAERTAAAGRSR